MHMKKFQVMFMYEEGGYATVTAKNKAEAEQKVYDALDEAGSETLERTKGVEWYEVTHRDFTSDRETTEL
jgi:hypothetical protein